MAVAVVVEVLGTEVLPVEVLLTLGIHIMEELLTLTVVDRVVTVLVTVVVAVAVAVGQVVPCRAVVLDLITDMVAVVVAEETPTIEVISLYYKDNGNMADRDMLLLVIPTQKLDQLLHPCRKYVIR